MKGKAKAHTNIALVKYWGKNDDDLILPNNDSISLTVDQFFTETSVTFSKSYNEDVFILNGICKVGKERVKVSRYLDFIRSEFNIDMYAKVESVNYVPTAAGLASSASAFAALAKACVDALGIQVSQKSLSRLARRGSGSASRSIYPSFSRWICGNDMTSVAHPIEVDWADFNIVMVVLDKGEKSLSSTEAMQQTVKTSPYYSTWVDEANKDADLMEKALYAKDFKQVGVITERSAMRMHAALLASDPPLWYFEPKTIEVINKVKELRRNGVEVYFTMDAGSNVKIICLDVVYDTLKKALLTIVDASDIIRCKAGSGV